MFLSARVLRPAMLVVVVVAIPATAMANEKMRRDMMARDMDKCIVGCLTNNDAVCEMLCGCVVDAFGKLPFADYVRLNIELNSSKISGKNNEYLTDTALVCAAEVDEAFPELVPGLKMPPAEDGD